MKIRTWLRTRQERLLLTLADESGSAVLVEMALVMPVLLITLTGMMTLGIAINRDLQLTDAVAIGGQVLAVDRGNTLDPCADVYTAVSNAAPYLDPTKMTFRFVLNGTPYPTTGTYSGGTVSCSSSSNSSGAAGNLVQGQGAQVVVTYPCSVSIFGNANLVPGCTLPAQISELVQ